MGDRSAEQLTGREYLRVSLDRSGRARSVDEQHADNARDAEREGIILGEAYRDNSRSASRYARQARDDFDRLMSDLGTGAFGAELLVLWESSRGSRKVGEWVELIEACERRRVRIRVTTHGRTYDPANIRDRRSLLEDAVDSEYESGKVSTRARRTAAANFAQGKPHGYAPYGYRRRYDERSRAYIAQELHPDEAPVVAELFSRLLAGHSLRSIATDFATRGIEKRSGGAFSAQHLRSLALNPSYAALRVHVPKQDTMSSGRVLRAALSEGSQVTEGAWPAVVSKEDFLAVRERLTDPTRVTSRPGRGKHLLSMIARCAECDGPLSAAYRASARQYVCHRASCVRIDADDLDTLATDLMIEYLSRPDVYDGIQAAGEPGGEHASERAAVRDEIAEIRARLGELADAVAAGGISVSLAARSEPQLLARLAAAEQRDLELTNPPALHGFVQPGVDIRFSWEQAPLSARRELARFLLDPARMGVLRVRRRPVGRRGGRHAMPAIERFELHRPTEL